MKVTKSREGNSSKISVDGSNLVYPSESYIVIDILINCGLFNREGRFLNLNMSD